MLADLYKVEIAWNLKDVTGNPESDEEEMLFYSVTGPFEN